MKRRFILCSLVLLLLSSCTTLSSKNLRARLGGAKSNWSQHTTRLEQAAEWRRAQAYNPPQ